MSESVIYSAIGITIVMSVCTLIVWRLEKWLIATGRMPKLA